MAYFEISISVKHRKDIILVFIPTLYLQISLDTGHNLIFWGLYNQKQDK